MNTYTTTSSSNTFPMPPTSDPLKLFMEDIEKTQTLSGKYVKIQTYLVSLKEEKSKIKGLDLPKSKQFLDHAIKTLEVEHDNVSEKLKSILNQTGVIDVDVLPEGMIRVSQNPSLNPTNTVLQAPQISMQSQQGTLHHGVGQQGSLQTKMQQQRLKLHLARQQQRQQRLLQPQVMKPSQLQQMIQQQQQQQQQQIMQAQRLQKGLLQPQVMKLNPKVNEPSQLQQHHRELLQQLGQQVFGQQE